MSDLRDWILRLSAWASTRLRVVTRQRQPVDVGRGRIEFVIWHDMASALIQLRENLLPYLES